MKNTSPILHPFHHARTGPGFPSELLMSAPSQNLRAQRAWSEFVEGELHSLESCPNFFEQLVAPRLQTKVEERWEKGMNSFILPNESLWLRLKKWMAVHV